MRDELSWEDMARILDLKRELAYPEIFTARTSTLATLQLPKVYQLPMGTREKANKCRKCKAILKTRKAKLCPDCSRREALPKMWKARRESGKRYKP